MNLESVSQHCPYCGEPIELLIDCSEPEQHYIEDCEVCCRPIEITLVVDENGMPEVLVSSENDT